MNRPKICVLFTGGTIGMIKDTKTNVLRSSLSAEEIIRSIPEIQKYVHIDYKFICNLDSSNLQPAHWSEIAQTIHRFYDKFDGFVVLHGTDTMAYTASALSFALINLGKPVVLTGSLIPLSDLGSDARNNLIYACLTASSDVAEVCIVFADKILRGNRSKKQHESFVDVFHSPNFPNLGELGRPIVLNSWRKKRRKRILKFQPRFESNIALFKIFPGFKPAIFLDVIKSGVKGVIVEGFGPGNIPFRENSLVPCIKNAKEENVIVVMANQLERGTTNLNTYEAGFQAAQAGAISAHDMTTEAAVTKLMWALAQTNDHQEIKKIFATDCAGEVNIVD